MKKYLLLFVFLLSLSPLFSQNFNLALRSQFSFPNEKVAGVWGYEKEGREYALVAGAKNLHIVEVTDPDAPTLVVSLPMADDWGKEVRTFRHFAFVSAEAGPGLVVFDLSKLPSVNLADYPKKEVKKAGGYNTNGHTLHIDTTAAVLYLNDGGWEFSWVFNLLPNPFSPSFSGFYEELGGIHDGYADNDTLFAAHINDGYVAVVDMRDKSNPVVLSTFETPGKFPHNTWLTRDRRYLLVADEISGGFISIWNISDLDDIREVSRFRPTPGSGSVPHNAFILNDYAFASWYRDGVILLDLSRPENIVQVGRFDTDSRSGDGYQGSWGNCPYLPSGNLLVSDYDSGLFVLTPTFARACYLEGNVKNAASKNPLAGVKVFIFNGDQVEPPLTSAQGEYRTGQSKAGKFDVIFYKDGYRPLLRDAELKAGEVTPLDAELVPTSAPGDDLPMLFLAAENNQPLANIEVVLRNELFQFQVKTDAKGWAKAPIVYADTFDIFPGFWGRLPLKGIAIDPAESPLIRLQRGYYDDFHFDLGWVSEGNAESGFWERGKIPDFNSGFNFVKNDVPDDLGDKCYTTGMPTEFDNPVVAKGTVRLVSPEINLKDYQQPVLSLKYWQQVFSYLPSDFSAFLENEAVRKEIWTASINGGNWFPVTDVPLPEEALEGNWRIVFEATNTYNHGFECCALEAGLDAVEIRDGQPAPALPIGELQVEVFPNPFHGHFFVRCLSPQGDLPLQWRLFDVAGRQVLSGQINSEAAVLELKPEVASGFYFFHIQQDEGKGKTMKLVKF